MPHTSLEFDPDRPTFEQMSLIPDIPDPIDGLIGALFDGFFDRPFDHIIADIYDLAVDFDGSDLHISPSSEGGYLQGSDDAPASTAKSCNEPLPDISAAASVGSVLPSEGDRAGTAPTVPQATPGTGGGDNMNGSPALHSAAIGSPQDQGVVESPKLATQPHGLAVVGERTCASADILAQRRRAVLEAIKTATVIDLTDEAGGKPRPSQGVNTPSGNNNGVDKKRERTHGPPAGSSPKRQKGESFPLRIESLKVRVDGEIRIYAWEWTSRLWKEIDERSLESRVKGQRYAWEWSRILRESIVALGESVDLGSVDEVVVRPDIGYPAWFALKPSGDFFEGLYGDDGVISVHRTKMRMMLQDPWAHQFFGFLYPTHHS